MSLTKRIEAVKARAAARKAAAPAPAPAIVHVCYVPLGHDGGAVAAVAAVTARRIATQSHLNLAII